MSTRRCAKANEGGTSAGSSNLYLVDEDEDGGEMREVTCEERERKKSAGYDQKETGDSPKSLKMFIISVFGQEESPKR